MGASLNWAHVHRKLRDQVLYDQAHAIHIIIYAIDFCIPSHSGSSSLWAPGNDRPGLGTDPFSSTWGPNREVQRRRRAASHHSFSIPFHTALTKKKGESCWRCGRRVRVRSAQRSARPGAPWRCRIAPWHLGFASKRALKLAFSEPLLPSAALAMKGAAKSQTESAHLSRKVTARCRSA